MVFSIVPFFGWDDDDALIDNEPKRTYRSKEYSYENILKELQDPNPTKPVTDGDYPTEWDLVYTNADPIYMDGSRGIVPAGVSGIIYSMLTRIPGFGGTGTIYDQEQGRKVKDTTAGDFGGADLRDMSMRNTYLGGAYMVNADLRGANLRNANLTEANLQGARLEGADMSNTVIHYTDFRGARLLAEDLSDFYLKPPPVFDAWVEQNTNDGLCFGNDHANRLMKMWWRIDKATGDYELRTKPFWIDSIDIYPQPE